MLSKTLFRTLRRMIERNQIKGLEEKIVFFHDNKKLEDEDYETCNSKSKSCKCDSRG